MPDQIVRYSQQARTTTVDHYRRGRLKGRRWPPDRISLCQAQRASVVPAVNSTAAGLKAKPLECLRVAQTSWQVDELGKFVGGKCTGKDRCRVCQPFFVFFPSRNKTGYKNKRWWTTVCPRDITMAATLTFRGVCGDVTKRFDLGEFQGRKRSSQTNLDSHQRNFIQKNVFHFFQQIKSAFFCFFTRNAHMYLQTSQLTKSLGAACGSP